MHFSILIIFTPRDREQVFHDIVRLITKGVMEELVCNILFGVLDLRSSILCETKVDVPTGVGIVISSCALGR